MAIKFDFNKLRTAVQGWLVGTDVTGTSLTAGEEAIYVPKLRRANPVMNIAAGVSKTLYNSDSGSTIFWDASTDGAIITLPEAEAGLTFKIIIDVTAHADAGCRITVGNATDYFYGVCTLIDSDTANQLDVQTAVRATSATTPANFDQIRLDGNGTAAGGEVGSTIDLYCADANGWFVQATMYTTGTPGSTAIIAAS